MPGPLKEYNASEVAMSFAGIPITGLADGEFVTIEMDTDDFGDVVGSDGEVASFRTNDRRAKVTFKLLQTSAAISRLMALSNADLAAINGAGVGALMVENLSTGERWEAPEARIMKQPNVSLGREVGSREFVIRAYNLIASPGVA